MFAMYTYTVLNIILSIGIFILLNFLFYKALGAYYKKEFGILNWKTGGGMVYFWQTSIAICAAATAASCISCTGCN